MAAPSGRLSTRRRRRARALRACLAAFTRMRGKIVAEREERDLQASKQRAQVGGTRVDVMGKEGAVGEREREQRQLFCNLTGAFFSERREHHRERLVQPVERELSD